MNDTLKKWLLYALGGLMPIWLLDTVLLPRLGFAVAPVLLPVCVVAMSVLEGAFSGAQFGLLTGLVWALTYAQAPVGRIPLLTLVGMLAGVVSQYALRRSLSGHMLCAAGVMVLMEVVNILGGLINALAAPGPLMLLAVKEFAATMVCAPLIYALFYKLYRKAGGKPV